MRKTTEKIICDKCNEEFTYQGTIISGMSFYHGGYGRDGDGGSKVEDKEFCSKCSKSFLEWFNNK